MIHPKHQSARNKLVLEIVVGLEVLYPRIRYVVLAESVRKLDAVWKASYIAVGRTRQPSQETREAVAMLLELGGESTYEETKSKPTTEGF